MTVHPACKRRVVLALLACAAGACSRAVDDRVADDSAPGAAATDTASGLVSSQGVSPLAAYPGFGHDHEADKAHYRRQEIALQRYIAQCMQEAGFQYTPTPSVVNPPAPLPPSLRQGPNERYTASLSPERRTRYNLTLYGVPDPNDEENLWDPRSPTGGGCWGEGIRAIPSVFKAKSELMPQLEAMRRAVERDPRVRAGEERWSACMRSRGFSFARPQSIHAQQDSAAIGGALTPEIDRRYREALKVAPQCVTAVGLDSIKTAVRVEREAEFVRAHKEVLDRHLERLRAQEPLVGRLLAQPPPRD
jgi:hypothetical protein